MTINVNDCFFYIKNGANIKQGVISGGIPITRIETLANDTFNRDKMGYAGIHDKKKYTEYILQDGDILMSHINSMAYLGRAVMYKMQKNECIIHGMNLLRLKANRNFILPEYAEYYLKSNTFKKYIKKIAKKSVNQASFSIADLKSIPLFLPNMVEQKKIYNTLNRIDNIISLKNQQLKKLDLLTKSLFVKMFINENYTKKKLGECAIINPKKSSDKRLHDELEVSFIPMMAVGENGQINVSKIKKFADVKNGFSYFSEGDVLFAKITPCMENGKGAIASNLCNGIGFGSTEFHVIRPIENITTSEWIYVLTTLQKFRLSAEANMTGSAGQKRVPASFLQDYSFYLPPIELQKQFSRVFKHLDKHKFPILD